VLTLAADAEETDHERAQRKKESGTNRQRPVKDVLALRHVLFPCFNKYIDGDKQQTCQLIMQMIWQQECQWIRVDLE
jgi:hypothetical protein